MSIKTIETKVRKLIAEYNAYYKQHREKVNALEKGYRECYFKCRACQKSSKLKNIIFLHIDWYDSWESIIGTSYALICPSCRTKNCTEDISKIVAPYTKCYKEIIHTAGCSYYNDFKKFDIYGEPATISSLESVNI